MNINLNMHFSWQKSFFEAMWVISFFIFCRIVHNYRKLWTFFRIFLLVFCHQNVCLLFFKFIIIIKVLSNFLINHGLKILCFLTSLLQIFNMFILQITRYHTNLHKTRNQKCLRRFQFILVGVLIKKQLIHMLPNHGANICDNNIDGVSLG